MPLIVPLTLLQHHLRRFTVPDWVHQQVYLDPWPKELMLRNRGETGELADIVGATNSLCKLTRLGSIAGLIRQSLVGRLECGIVLGLTQNWF